MPIVTNVATIRKCRQAIVQKFGKKNTFFTIFSVSIKSYFEGSKSKDLMASAKTETLAKRTHLRENQILANKKKLQRLELSE